MPKNRTTILEYVGDNKQHLSWNNFCVGHIEFWHNYTV